MTKVSLSKELVDRHYTVRHWTLRVEGDKVWEGEDLCPIEMAEEIAAAVYKALETTGGNPIWVCRH